jgi:ketosteroid isomerase-like protein
MDAAVSVGGLYQAYQDRDWAGAAGFLHPDVVLEMPSTAERLVGRDAVMAFQQSYPEPWGDLTVLRLVSDQQDAAAEVRVVDPSGREFLLAAFWRAHQGLLHAGVEYWVTVGAEAPPPVRASSPATIDARQAWDGRGDAGSV